MKNSILSIIDIAILFIFFAIISCNKYNPVTPTPPEQPDTSNRFDWEEHIVGNQYLAGLYVADSNDIYIESFDFTCIHYDGKTFKNFDFQDPTYQNVMIYGYDKNNIFFAGHQLIQNKKETERPVLKKLTNNVLSTFVLDTLQTTINDIFVTGPNQAWLAAYDYGKAYFFNNNLITTYTLNGILHSITGGKFYKDKFDNLFIFYGNSPYGDSVSNLYTYKFIDNNFQLLRIDCLGYSSGCLGQDMYRVGKEIVMYVENKSSNKALYYYDGNKWTYYCNTLVAVDPVFPVRVGGWSKDSLVVFYNKYSKIYLFNGITWRKENVGTDIQDVGGLFSFPLEVKDGNVYISIFSDSKNLASLIIGKPKKSSTIKQKLKE